MGITSKDIFQYIEQLEENSSYKDGIIDQLERQIEDMKNIKTLFSKNTRVFQKDQYTKEEINQAYQKTLKYEGLWKDQFDTILNTFCEFLDKTHHSLK